MMLFVTFNLLFKGVVFRRINKTHSANYDIKCFRCNNPSRLKKSHSS